jgi:hypothetical protein
MAVGRVQRRGANSIFAEIIQKAQAGRTVATVSCIGWGVVWAQASRASSAAGLLDPVMTYGSMDLQHLSAALLAAMQRR